MLEYQGKRADADIFDVVAQQFRIGIRQNQADNQNGEDIKQQDTPEHLTHRTRNIFFRLFRFARGNTNQFGALE